MSVLPIILYPPDDRSGRRVRADGTILGLAYSPQDWNEMDVVRSELIEWRGGGQEVWGQ